MNPIHTSLLAATIAIASAQASATEWNNQAAPPCLTVDDATCRKINAYTDFRIQELAATCMFITKRFNDLSITQHCMKIAVETALFEADDMRMMENER